MANENIAGVEDNENIKYVRPASITLISVWLILSALMIVWLVFRGYGTSSNVNTPLLAIGGIVSLLCGVGFWLMKKWAVYVFAIFAVIDQVALLLLGRWNVFSLLFFVVVIYVGYKHRSEMS